MHLNIGVHKWNHLADFRNTLVAVVESPYRATLSVWPGRGGRREGGDGDRGRL
jgi:hypothetical protein